MDHERDTRIQERAYELWERAGQSGPAEDHWVQAEQELGAGTPEAGGAVSHEAPPAPSDDAQKMAEQVEVAIAARPFRSKQTGRSGQTAEKKPAPKSTGHRQS
jgi:Protein of unknown function (DUF2934)